MPEQAGIKSTSSSYWTGARVRVSCGQPVQGFPKCGECIGRELPRHTLSPLVGRASPGAEFGALLCVACMAVPLSRIPLP